MAKGEELLLVSISLCSHFAFIISDRDGSRNFSRSKNKILNRYRRTRIFISEGCSQGFFRLLWVVSGPLFHRSYELRGQDPVESEKSNNSWNMRIWLECRLSTGVYNLVRFIISKKPVVAIPNGYTYPLILLKNSDCSTLDQFAPNPGGLRV